jgi:pimeloyl-ACP methyl ester carboxylesterase
MELFYRQFGEGKPLIILHGLLGISDNWVSYAKQVSASGYRVYIPDQRNHGHSPHHQIFNYYALTDDLHEFIEQRQIKSPVLLGHSMGGKVAMRYALENADQVERIIIVDTSLRTYVRFNYHLKLIDAMQSINFDFVKTRQEVETQLAERIPDPRMIRFLMKNLFWKERHKLGWRPDLQSISYHIDSMYDGVFYSTRFEGPALFIRGGQSDYVLEEDYQAIRTNFPQASIETIHEGSHWVHADAPEEFQRITMEFLQRR